MKRSGRIVGIGCFGRQQTAAGVFKKIVDGYFPEDAAGKSPDSRATEPEKTLTALLKRLTAARAGEPGAGLPGSPGEIAGAFIAVEGRQLNLAVFSRASGEKASVWERCCRNRVRSATRAHLRVVG